MIETVEVLPKDEHNAALTANVYPPDWTNPEPAARYNLVVIGGGTAGLVTAVGAAGLGAKVALIERRSLGGDCLNVGCVPSKALIRSARSAFDISDIERFGVSVSGASEVNFAGVMERMRRLRAHISHHDSAERFRVLGVDVFLGDARFSGSDTVEVDGKTLRFKKAVIATGARPMAPPAEGLAEAGFLTNETVFSLTELPDRLAVIGGGPIGCELAQTFRRLGSEVSIVGRAPHFLPREDPEAAAILEAAFRNEGVNLWLGTALTKVTMNGAAKVVHMEKDGVENTIEVDEILVGAGRAPNVEGLNLEAVGVEYGKKGVVVDDNLRTTNPRIFAAGDVCLNYKFTHTADAAARVVIQNALFWGRKKFSALTVPWCTYTDPEIAHVGLYEKEAEKQGVAIETFTRKFEEVDRAIVEGETSGMVKVSVKKGTDKIVGATIVARHAGEMISEITLAIVGGVGLKTISGVIHPYPTQAEAIKQAADAYSRTRLTPLVKSIFSKLMALQR